MLNKSGNTLLAVLIAGLVFIVGIIGFLYWKNSNSKATKQQEKNCLITYSLKVTIGAVQHFPDGSC